eukprot:320447-Chlamydomonas_euryale.AAC.3
MAPRNPSAIAKKGALFCILSPTHKRAGEARVNQKMRQDNILAAAGGCGAGVAATAPACIGRQSASMQPTLST